MPSQLPELADQLKAAGLEPTPRSAGTSRPIPGRGVVSLGGCPASFVSDQDLAVTNHRYACGSIRHNSTDEDNILERGFLAQTFADELPAATGSSVLVTTAIEDVTAPTLAAVHARARGKERFDAIEAAEKALGAECEAEDGVR